MNDTLLAVMAFFVFLSAVALCIQAVMLILMARTAKALQGQVSSALPQVKAVLARAEAMLEENRKNILDITSRANEISSKASEVAARATEVAAKANDLMDLGKAQMVKLDGVVSDATQRAKIQLERAELVMDDTVGRVHHTVTAVHNGVIRPVRELQGLAAGMRAAVNHLVNGGRPSVADVTHDDEMFIG